MIVAYTKGIERRDKMIRLHIGMRRFLILGLVLLLLLPLVSVTGCAGTQQPARASTLTASLEADLTISGSGFAPNESVRLVLVNIAPGVDQSIVRAVADKSGAFKVVDKTIVPNLIKGSEGTEPLKPGDYTLTATGSENSAATTKITVAAKAKK
jgi:hypothetical protein